MKILMNRHALNRKVCLGHRHLVETRGVHWDWDPMGYIQKAFFTMNTLQHLYIKGAGSACQNPVCCFFLVEACDCYLLALCAAKLQIHDKWSIRNIFFNHVSYMETLKKISLIFSYLHDCLETAEACSGPLHTESAYENVMDLSKVFKI